MSNVWQLIVSVIIFYLFLLINQEISDECEKLDYAGKLYAYKCDLTREDEIETMFTWIQTKHGGVDVCINNAGIAIEENLLGK